MSDKTIVMRKAGHWYVINSETGDEKEMLLTLLQYSENKEYNIEQTDVLSLADQLGWEIDVYPNVGAA